MQRRTLLQTSAALGSPAVVGFAQQKRHAQVPRLHGTAVQRVAQHAQAVDGQSVKRVGRAHAI